MSEPHDDAPALRRCEQALRLVCADLPHLAGIAQAVRLSARSDIKTAGVFASGRLVFCPDFVMKLSWMQLTFVMAHELLHLALETHHRGAGSDALLVNVAHDLIINDQLFAEMGDPEIPGILRFAGARHHSLEKMLFFLRRSTPPAPGWPSSGKGTTETAMGRALREAGLLPETASAEGDVLDENTESLWYPDESPRDLAEQAQNVRDLAGQARSLETFFDHYTPPGEGPDVPSPKRRRIEAQSGENHAPWEQALQRWLDAVAPAARTYARTSRRGGDRTDIVLPGRNRDNWTLHVVLDTSGSMFEHLPHVLAALAEGCRSVGVEQLHLIQCDVAIRREDWLTPEQIEHLATLGFSGWEGANVPEDRPEPPPPEEAPAAPPEPIPEPTSEEKQPPPAVAAPPIWSPPPPAWDYVPSSTPRYVPPPTYYSPPPHQPSGNKRRGVLPGLGRAQHGGRGVKGANKRKHASRRRRPSEEERERSRRYASWSDFVSAEALPPAHAAPEDSDLTPALLYLAGDPSVESVIILSDGLVGYPLDTPPFHTLWVVPAAAQRDSFQPPYGHVIALRD